MNKSALTSAALLAGLLTHTAASTNAHAADSCQPSRLMVLLDKSSSMLNPIADQSMWEIAKGALVHLTGAYQDKLEIGLSVFPAEGQCSPGSVVVEPAMNSTAQILAALAEPPPSAGNWTPMAETLEAASQFASLTDPGVPSYAVLITDGWQYCLPEDPTTRFAPVEAVERLNMAGITTYVVGFGDGVDVETLNRVAVAAGTDIPGCDPTGTEASGSNHCYYQAGSSAELVDALMDVAQLIPGEEICDGLDNDCDGEIDEAVVQVCANSCGLAGQSVCSAGAWGECEASETGYEICDGLDNDCDGETDELDADGEELCGPDSTCTDGTCEQRAVSGCGCKLASGGTSGALGSLLPLLLGAFVLRRRRRE